MNKRQFFTVAAGCVSLCGALYGQAGEKTASFQYFMTNDTGPGNVMFRVDGIGGKTVKDKPFSATEERETVQVLGDGTRIDKKETNKYYRDTLGRTRIERDNGATVTISDPVAGFSAEMSTANKTAHKMMVRTRTGGAISVAGTAIAQAPTIVMMDKMKAELDSTKAIAGSIGSSGMGASAIGSSSTSSSETMIYTKTVGRSMEAENSASEDLGTQIVNGVPAQGTRSTISIPVGQIGNDREIKVTSERWYSPDLQMLIRSTNKDPRFGETTYQLNNLLQGAQDPSLFQIPADFSINGPR